MLFLCNNWHVSNSWLIFLRRSLLRATLLAQRLFPPTLWNGPVDWSLRSSFFRPWSVRFIASFSILTSIATTLSPQHFNCARLCIWLIGFFIWWHCWVFSIDVLRIYWMRGFLCGLYHNFGILRIWRVLFFAKCACLILGINFHFFVTSCWIFAKIEFFLGSSWFFRIWLESPFVLLCCYVLLWLPCAGSNLVADRFLMSYHCPLTFRILPHLLILIENSLNDRFLFPLFLCWHFRFFKLLLFINQSIIHRVIRASCDFVEDTSFEAIISKI